MECFYQEAVFSPGAAEPSVLEETTAYAVVYKPPWRHTAPLEKTVSPGEPSARTLLSWYAGRCPQVLTVYGRKAREGGLLHRLDYETQGLVLFAKTQTAMDALTQQQREGLFVKEYGALSRGSQEALPGFPPAFIPGPVPFTIQSAFRPFGKGRKTVRPVVPAFGGKAQKKFALDLGNLYTTQVLEMRRGEKGVYFRMRISRGFRHQIRCHLAWLGFPILNDKIYGGGSSEDGVLALRAQGISFIDPESNTPRRYELKIKNDIPELIRLPRFLRGGGSAFLRSPGWII
jgi:23S rRNA pseudouridine1911/1915/1917 synthase